LLYFIPSALLTTRKTVLRRETVAAVDDEHDDVRFLDRLAGLTRHLMQDAVFRDRLEAAGIDDQIRPVAGAPLAVMAIAGETGQVGNQRIARTRETVE
jgi:hypothetical protein